jgi:hypothetical protein
MEPLLLPSGYGFRTPFAGEITARGTVLDTLTIFEAPRTRGPRRYILGVDVADGLGQDASVIQVLRMGTIEEPTEQVAEYASDQILPAGLAYVAQAIGEYYRDADGLEALIAVETNSHGLSTQDTLKLHLGYSHFYRWEYLDAADAQGRYSTKEGWYTTPRTRAALLTKLRDAICTYDEITGWPDLLTHSPYLHDEFKDFQTEGAVWEAAAARGAHDDRVMALAIAYYVSFRLQAGETEPLDERRRRRTEQQALLKAASAERPDWRNTPATMDDVDQMVDGEAFDTTGWG